jgi:hypothetical protein
MTSPLEQLGRTAGWIASPVFAAVAALRHARVFHPMGELLEGTVEASVGAERPADQASVGAERPADQASVGAERPADQPSVPSGDVKELAAALEGSVLARFSGALWKKPGSHLPDVLGCALRIGGGRRGDQDLLFATIRRPWTMGLSPLTTDVDDYLANHYFAVSPFAFHGMARRFYLRLRPLQRGGPGEDRRERLARRLADGPIALALEAAYRPRGPWRQTAIVRLDRFAAGDDPRLRFDPFANGRGVQPRGVIHALRRGAYTASQAARIALISRGPRGLGPRAPTQP